MLEVVVICLFVTYLVVEVVYSCSYPFREGLGREKSMPIHVRDCGLLYPAVFAYAWIVAEWMMDYVK